jgi:enoyl-CoA hydratase/carnithine racemase
MTSMPPSASPQSWAVDALSLAFEPGAAVLTLNRPAQRNAIQAAMWQALPDALRAAAAPGAPAVLVVRGAGADFAAGADIAEFDTVFADRALTLRYAQTMADAMDALARWPGPTLALIAGHCIGAGVALALACDIRCAAADARFGVTPARLGLLYPLADTRRLVRAVGESKARDLLYTGRLFGADEALAMRLVDEVHAPAALQAAVFDKARQIGAQSPWSVRHAKAVVALIGEGVATDTEQTRAWFADAVEGEEHRLRLAAFRSRRQGG